MSNKKIMMLAVILGLVAVFLTNFYLTRERAAINNVQKAQVLVAKTLIPAKTEVKSDMVEVKLIPRDYIHSQAVTKLESLTGKITLVDIVPGEQLLTSKFVSSKDASQGLDYTIPKGKRAIAVGVNEVTGVAKMVKPGNKVDVIGTLDVDRSQAARSQGTPVVAGASAGASQTSTIPVSKILLQDITVLAVDQRTDNLKVADSKDSTANETKTLTLAVTPEEAQKLTLITERGTIRIILRSPVDTGKYSLRPFSSKDF